MIRQLPCTSYFAWDDSPCLLSTVCFLSTVIFNAVLILSTSYTWIHLYKWLNEHSHLKKAVIWSGIQFVYPSSGFYISVLRVSSHHAKLCNCVHICITSVVLTFLVFDKISISDCSVTGRALTCSAAWISTSVHIDCWFIEADYMHLLWGEGHRENRFMVVSSVSVSWREETTAETQRMRRGTWKDEQYIDNRLWW